MIRSKQRKSFADFFCFILEILPRLLRPFGKDRISWTVLTRQILYTGFEALPLIGFIALAMGGLIILQGNILLSTFGQGIWLYHILVTLVISELSGLITALVVIARSGTAISTELGNMKVNQEIALLESFGISPTTYLVVSRIWGVVISTVVLSFYFNVIAVLGGWLFATIFYPLGFRSFISNLVGVLGYQHVAMAFLKSLVFGFLISVIACYQGLSVKSASTEVPQRTIKAVVSGIAWVIVADIIITWLFWMLA
ncbi:MAG: ABC transporter permease [Candidatus Cloacimonetes bacterium]|nr:ABC transporter permease [Candidatus Cloacimonadota bacterium]